MKFIIVETMPFYMPDEDDKETARQHERDTTQEMFPASAIIKAWTNSCGTGENGIDLWNVAVDIMDPGRMHMHPEGTRFYINDGPHTKEMATRNLIKLCKVLNEETEE